MTEAACIAPSDTDAPLWTPDQARIDASHLEKFRKEIETKFGQSLPGYHALWQWSVDNQEDFWNHFWDFASIIGDKGDVVLENPTAMPGAKFFPNGTLNFAENLLRRRDDTTALVFRGEDKIEHRLTWTELYNRVSQLRQVLLDHGVDEGDRVAGFVSNMPEAIMGILAASSIGAVWSSASPDFGVQGVIDRFGQIEPKILIAVDGYFYNGKEIDCLEKLAAIQPQLPTLKHTLVVPYRDKKPDLSALTNASNFDEILDTKTVSDIPFQRFAFNHPLVIMFSSGTTGIPKCIVHGAGGTLIQQMKEHLLQCDVKKNDRVFYFTTCGWMMWNWLIAGLACEATLLLYDGSPFYPDGNALWDYAAAEKMTLFGTAAKYVDALRKADIRPKDSHDLSSLKHLTSTGSPLVHESFDYIHDAIKQDLHVAPIYGGTDIICASFGIGNPISPVWRGEMQGAGLATAIDVFDDDGNSMASGAGEIVCRKPIPSMPIGFWNDPDGARYHAAYFERYPNIWHHGDWVEKTMHDGLIVYGRSDATLNPGGVRIGTAEIYRQVEQIDEVIESIVVGQQWDDDVRVVLFVRLAEGATLSDDLQKRIKGVIRSGASPRHVPAKILVVSDIPRTKSGKITEIAVRDIIHGKTVKNAHALANPEALELYKDLPELQS